MTTKTCADIHRELFPTYDALLEECCAKEKALIEADATGLTLNAYHQAAMRTANPECIDLSNAALGLCGEAGEFADCVKKHLHQGHALDREKLVRELGDCAWYLALACEVLGVTMQDVAAANVRKLEQRYPAGFSHAASVGRKDAL